MSISKIKFSYHIPIEIEVEIIKWLPVKSLIKFRCVSKTWKSLIDSSEFIVDHNAACHTRPKHHVLVSYVDFERKYVSIVDDEIFKQQNLSLSLKSIRRIVGSSQGLFCCFYTKYKESYANPDDSNTTNMARLWNPAIRKSVDIVLPNVLENLRFKTVVGFGICPNTCDPMLVKITFMRSLPSESEITPTQVEVFTLRSRVWRGTCNNLPRKSVFFTHNQVVIDHFIYWRAYDKIYVDDKLHSYYLIMSFNMISEEFTELYLSNNLALKRRDIGLHISKRSESLVVIQCKIEADKRVYVVWMMNNDDPKSFTNFFTINPPHESIRKVLGFRKSGKPMILRKHVCLDVDTLFFYEPCSKRIESIGISGDFFSFFVSSYMETLLLLDHTSIN